MKFAGILARYGIGILIGAGLALVLATEATEWARSAKAEAVVIQAHRTKRVEKWREVEVPVVVRVPAPPAKDLGQLRQDWGRPDLVGAPESHDVPPVEGGSRGLIPQSISGALVLGEWDLPKLPWGGKALGVREMDGRVSLSVKPSPRPFLELPMRWEAGALVTAWPDQDVSAWVGIDLLRVGRFTISPVLTGGYAFDTSAARAGVGAKVVFH